MVATVTLPLGQRDGGAVSCIGIKRLGGCVQGDDLRKGMEVGGWGTFRKIEDGEGPGVAS
jgi:hypothetical protein